jgi:phage terminase large subunit
MQSASSIIEQIHQISPDCVFIDEGGVGGPILDRVKQIIGDKVIGVQFGSKATDPIKYFNKRAEMWGRTRDAMRAGLQLPDIRELKYDLLGPLYFFSPSEQIKIERKEEMKKRGLASPDYADALCLTYAETVIKSNESAFNPQVVSSWSG